VTYNTLRSGLLDGERRLHFERIIKALCPDIIALQEQDNANAVSQLITTWLPNQIWHTSSLYHGELFVVSKYPVLQGAALISSDRMHAVLLSTQENVGSNLLIINTHLACCRQDDLRQQDADEFIKVMREWSAGTGPFALDHATPFVSVGDFNLVGFCQQVRTLRDGDILNEATYGSDFPPDWDGTSVADLFSRHTHVRMGYTWRYDLSSFSPGKLDYVFYSNSVIDVGNHFVLNTLGMSEQDLTLYGLQRQDTQIASDHLPRIVDIASVHPVGVKDESHGSDLPDDFGLCSVYPNPFHSTTRIEYTLLHPSRVALRIHNLLGQEIRTLVDEVQPAGWRLATWDGKNAHGDAVGAGLYLCIIENGKTSRTEKVILLE
jgi:endonuclease/exonuclease/phosphatase family metal-dependent hydrolase